ncbi:hypothetical protein CDD83_2382 [Cordyceps sp. RAO-2017]|nr:hypothetical protein CDD83_2382 [Cordyceps sp. RAO-2017]
MTDPSALVTVTVSFRRPGTQPPLFLVGTFSDPAWLPREMQYRTDDTGDKCFTTQISVQPGQDYRYKFRLGHGGDWLLDQQASIDIDDQGSCANLLKVPLTDGSAEQLPTPPEAVLDTDHFPQSALRESPEGLAALSKTLAHSAAGEVKMECLQASGCPPAAGALGSGATLGYPGMTMSSGSSDPRARPYDGEDWKSPLFAHEAFGEAGPADAGSDHDPQDLASKSPVLNYSFGDDYVDADDPTLERFPSERSSVLDTLRKLQSSYDENHPHLDEMSPREMASRKGFADSLDENGLLTSPNLTASRVRESRASHTSLGPARSVASLSSIAEEPRPEPVPSQRCRATGKDDMTPPADEDEALTMRFVKA